MRLRGKCSWVYRSVPANIVLIGFSGTGKSTAGKLIASRLGWTFVDTDSLIVAHFGMSIAEVFAEQGEAIFRAVERDIVATVCAGTRQVVSLGGGAPVDLENRQRILDKNFIVCLGAAPETILQRLRTGPGAEKRPMLAGEDPLGRIRRLLEARREAYEIADVTIDTEGRTPADVSDAVLKAVENSRGWTGCASAPTSENSEIT